MSNLQILIRLVFIATVLLNCGASINAFIRLHPNFPDTGGIFNGDGEDEILLRAEKWSKFHGSKINRFHGGGVRGMEWCKPLKMEAERMAQCKDRGRIPVKNECRGFLMCLRKGDKPIPSCCPYGLFFDHLQRTCVGKTDAHCYNVCQKSDAKYPDPSNPQKYFECSDLGIPESVSCPKTNPDAEGVSGGDTLVFDPKTKQCKNQETIDTEIDTLLGKDFDNAFQRTFGVPSFQVFNEDDFSQKAPVTSTSTPTLKPTTKVELSSSSSSPPDLSPVVGFGPQPTKYKQLIDMADDDSDSNSSEDTYIQT